MRKGSKWLISKKFGDEKIKSSHWSNVMETQLIEIKQMIQLLHQIQAKNLMIDREIGKRDSGCKCLYNNSCSMVPHALGADMAVYKWMC